MDKIRKREFTGSPFILLVLGVSGIGIPIAVIYLINATIETEYEIEDAEGFWENYKAKRKWWHFFTGDVGDLPRTTKELLKRVSRR